MEGCWKEVNGGKIGAEEFTAAMAEYQSLDISKFSNTRFKAG